MNVSGIASARNQKVLLAKNLGYGVTHNVVIHTPAARLHNKDRFKHCQFIQGGLVLLVVVGILGIGLLIGFVCFLLCKIVLPLLVCIGNCFVCVVLYHIGIIFYFEFIINGFLTDVICVILFPLGIRIPLVLDFHQALILCQFLAVFLHNRKCGRTRLISFFTQKSNYFTGKLYLPCVFHLHLEVTVFVTSGNGGVVNTITFDEAVGFLFENQLLGDPSNVGTVCRVIGVRGHGYVQNASFTIILCIDAAFGNKRGVGKLNVGCLQIQLFARGRLTGTTGGLLKQQRIKLVRRKRNGIIDCSVFII